MIHETTMNREHIFTLTENEYNELLELLNAEAELQPSLLLLIDEVKQYEYDSGFRDGEHSERYGY